MQAIDTAEAVRRLAELRSEHRDLDAAIAGLVALRAGDEMQLRRLKKRKLRIKDMIAWLEDQLIPDLNA
jgi:hypothetical protein